MSEADRARLALAALRNGTAARIRTVHGWTTADLARACNVSTGLLASWEAGEQAPAPATAVKLWTVLVHACTAPPPNVP
ncbi:multiprotein-bridging factor 1 family protein [Streptomyces andamanensis]|uniref:Multiprotein-bridging factor 1 family protein n=1 Tax=Streptomyces andamanensis TaxID=1565035 RepID=A0ABV8TCE6_9ACTN